MATILIFGESRRRTFWRGFWKGVAAPVALYQRVYLPEEARSVKTTPLPDATSGDLGQDWAQVGAHLRSALANSARRRA